VAARGGKAPTECPSCGAELPRGARLCVECGYNLETGEQVGMAGAVAAAPAASGDVPSHIPRRAKIEVGETADEQTFRWKGWLWVLAGVAIIGYGVWQYFDISAAEAAGEVPYFRRSTRRLYNTFGKWGVVGSAVVTGLVSAVIGYLQVKGRIADDDD
jgi:hypothetical protein